MKNDLLQKYKSSRNRASSMVEAPVIQFVFILVIPTMARESKYLQFNKYLHLFSRPMFHLLKLKSISFRITIIQNFQHKIEKVLLYRRNCIIS